MLIREVIKRISETVDSFYLYDESKIIERTQKLRSCFPDVAFLYSIKCNHHPHVVRTVFSQGFGADAASLGEVRIAAGCGLAPDEIFYSAPGKSRRDIEGAWDRATLIADSLGEIEQIEQIAADKREIIHIGVRLNPAFAFDGGTGLPSKFGIDEEQFLSFEGESRHPHVRITGLHVHLKSQELRSEILARYYRNIMDLADRIEAGTGSALDYLNLGSGIGIPYSVSDSELDLDSLSRSLDQIRTGRNVRILIEVGRYAVGKSGYYVTKVMDRKVSRGKTFLILKNTLNGFLRPSLARLVEHYAAESELAGSEPLYTGRNSFAFWTMKDAAGRTETVDLAGNLCTSSDIIAENVTMPPLDRGDIVIINNAGAYAAVLSPMDFSSQEKPPEFFLKSDGTLLE